MNKKFLLTPSIYCADTANFQTEIKKLQIVGINWIHFDVMDGIFVQNYALGPKILNDIKKHYPNLTVDVHIMGIDLINKIPLFIKADYITFHWTSVKNNQEVNKLIAMIKQQGTKVGIALDLQNDIGNIKEFLPTIDLITLMAIKPGFTGQRFELITWKNIQKIKMLKQQYPHLLFQVDGGVRWNNMQQLIANGVDLIVVGSLLFKEKDYQNVIDKVNKLEIL